MRSRTAPAVKPAATQPLPIVCPRLRNSTDSMLEAPGRRNRPASRRPTDRGPRADTSASSGARLRRSRGRPCRRATTGCSGRRRRWEWPRRVPHAPALIAGVIADRRIVRPPLPEMADERRQKDDHRPIDLRQAVPSSDGRKMFSTLSPSRIPSPSISMNASSLPS